MMIVVVYLLDITPFNGNVGDGDVAATAPGDVADAVDGNDVIVDADCFLSIASDVCSSIELLLLSDVDFTESVR